MKIVVSKREIIKMTYEEYFSKYEEITYRNIGTSMYPMLKPGRDLFTLEKKTDEQCRKYDVVLYRRISGQYVLHRIVEVREDEYVILGDNCEAKEYGIKEEQIIAVLTSFVHKGKTIQVSDCKYQIYVHIWYWIYPFRSLIIRMKRRMKNIKMIFG